jgi:hypothetical protein
MQSEIQIEERIQNICNSYSQYRDYEPTEEEEDEARAFFLEMFSREEGDVGEYMVVIVYNRSLEVLNEMLKYIVNGRQSESRAVRSFVCDVLSECRGEIKCTTNVYKSNPKLVKYLWREAVKMFN